MQVTAFDEANKKVAWFFIYKVPQLSAGARLQAGRQVLEQI
jgi:hypothetical protein